MQLATLSLVAWLVGGCGGDREPAAPPRPPPRPAELDAARVPDAALANADLVARCFAQPRRYAVPDAVTAMTAADLDHDGHVDLVVAYNTFDPGSDGEVGHVVVYRGLGNGDLLPAARVATAGTYAIATGDLAGDGTVDLLVVPYPAEPIQLFFGQVDGSFGVSITIPTVADPVRVALADVDGDGRADIVIEEERAIAVYRGRGGLDIRNHETIMTGRAPSGPAVADFDGDGAPDLAFVDHDTFFTLRDRHGRLRRVATAKACSNPAFPVAADLDHDGDVDVAYTCDDHRIQLRLGDGHGRFEVTDLPFDHVDEPVVLADVTGDGAADVVIIQHPDASAAHLSVLARAGPGGWTTRGEADLDVQLTHPLAADVDGDGRLDLVAAAWNTHTANLLVFRGRGCL